MSVTFDEREKIRCIIKKEKSDLFNSILEKRRHYKQRYYDYLKSDEWKKKRLERLKLDNFICQNCGNKSGRLDVHHTTYDTLYNESIYDIITLCHPCHFKLHEND
jgi:5-methylcytosine-specific restriction endonuclease McrA